MKEHAKKALKHDVEVLGKTVPTIAVVALFLIGSGSAAVLTSFGTVTGEADVTQAIQLDGNNGEASLSYSFSSVVGGDTTVDTYTITNNMDESYDLTYSSDMVVDAGNTEELDQAGTKVEWSDSVGGIDTTYAQYHDEAGHDFSSYTSPSGDLTVNAQNGDDDGSSPYASIQAALNDAQQGDTILVKSGDYSDFTVSTDDVTVVAANSPTNTDDSTVSGASTGILVQADGVKIKGFDVQADAPNAGNARGIDIQGHSVEVTQNYVHNVVAEARPIGIFLWGDDTAVNGSEVTNNKIESVQATKIDGGSSKSESKTRAIALDSATTSTPDADDVAIMHNTVSDIGNSTTAAMSNGIEINGGTAKNFEVTYNIISDVDHDEGYGYTPRAAGFYVTGYKQGVDYGNHKVAFNNFELSAHDATADVKHWDNPDAGTLNADNNYWGEEGIQYGVQDVLYTTDGGNSEVSVSWNVLDEVEPGSTTLAVVNDFPVYIDGSETYTLTTTVK